MFPIIRKYKISCKLCIVLCESNNFSYVQSDIQVSVATYILCLVVYHSVLCSSVFYETLNFSGQSRVKALQNPTSVQRNEKI